MTISTAIAHRKLKHELFNDHFQNSKRYPIQKAQLIIADIPYNIGKNAYGSSPEWYVDGDNKNGESKLANSEFFDTDKNFRIPEFLHFCSKMLLPEPKETGKAPCMIVFCAFDQQFKLIEEAKKHGLNNYINLVFVKNSSSQVLKANMRVVGNCEYGLILYRDKLPKFNNHGKMIFNAIPWESDTNSEKIHPCLPAGEMVFFNGGWKKIEDIKVGDSNQYGTVSHTTQHEAEKLVEIKCGKNTTISTWNHPFLVKRGSQIFWVNADQITESDLVLSGASVYNTQKPYLTHEKGALCEQSTKKHPKDICGLKQTKTVNSVLNIVLFGKGVMANYHSVCRYITLILTKQIMTLPICNLSLPLSISGCTLVADLSMENGKNHAQYAENSNQLQKNIGISQGGGLTESSVKYASAKKALKQEKFLLQKVGSVKIIHQKMRVYNLTIDGVPAFDTKIGVSHNTQKPVRLIERLISIFTDPGDVVIDPCAGSASTIIAAIRSGRAGYGFEIKKDFFASANNRIKNELAQGDMFRVTTQAIPETARLFA